MILVDSNVLIDVLDENQAWREWSVDQLVSLADASPVVNQIAFAEVAPRMTSLAAFQDALSSFEIGYEPLGEDAAFAAGQAFQDYRARRSEAKMVLPDFLIGGHAQSIGATILTRDPRFYRSYFPGVSLITPSKDEE